MLSLDELDKYLAGAQADYEIIRHGKPILTTADADGLFDTGKAAPVFILETENGLIALIIKARSEHINLKRLKKQLGFSRLKFADRNMVTLQTG